MNKNKMGRFLRKLREEKNKSQEDLTNDFRKAFFEVSVNAISSWENGKTVPDIDKLYFLCEYYNVTIDDILNGEKYEEVDFDQIYLMHQNEYFLTDYFASRFKDEKYVNAVYKYITEEGVVIRSKFKKHVMDLINGSISRNDIKELSFFLKNFYTLDENFSISSYFAFLRSLKNKRISPEEKWWETQRYVFPIDSMSLTFQNICDEGFIYEVVQKRMNYSENWEKDMLLSLIQFNDAVSIDPNKVSAKSIKRYEEEHGKQFDREKLTKDAIRYLIENGALINTEFLSYQKGEAHTVRIIDGLEKAYDAVAKPLKFCVRDGDDIKFYFAENNPRNRLLTKYDYEIIRPLRRLGYSYDQIYELADKNEKIPNEVYLKAAQLNGIDTNREERFIIADMQSKGDLIYAEHCLQEYHQEERVQNIGYYDDLELLRDELLKGNYTNILITTTWIGGINYREKIRYVFQKKPYMSYLDFVRGRQIDRTKRLLESLDSLSVEQIRSEFFQIGGQENE